MHEEATLLAIAASLEQYGLEPPEKVASMTDEEVHRHAERWAGELADLFDTLPPDVLVTVVDAHVSD